METFLWDPDQHPEQQYGSVQEQACEAAALISHISKTLPTLQVADQALSSSQGQISQRRSSGFTGILIGSSRPPSNDGQGGHRVPDWLSQLFEMRESNDSSSLGGGASQAGPWQPPFPLGVEPRKGRNDKGCEPVAPLAAGSNNIVFCPRGGVAATAAEGASSRRSSSSAVVEPFSPLTTLSSAHGGSSSLRAQLVSRSRQQALLGTGSTVSRLAAAAGSQGSAISSSSTLGLVHHSQSSSNKQRPTLSPMGPHGSSQGPPDTAMMLQVSVVDRTN